MITLERPAYFTNERYAEYCGLSDNDKATIDANNADEFYEIDTGKTYKYNETSGEWVEQPAQTTAVDTGLPPITAETTGHFLSNDGSVTHWQTIGSENFVIQLTENSAEDTYTADKTWVEIKAAYDAKQNIVVRVDSSELRLMNAQFANNGNKAGFTFGYTEVQTGGQRVVTRAIQYSHDEDGDNWSGSDYEANLSNYLSLDGGIMNGALTLAGEPENDSHATTKKYVDDRTLVVAFRHDQTAGLLTSTPIQEITNAILAKRLVYATLNGDTYNVSASSAAEVSFSHVDAVNKQVTTISYNSVDGTWSKQTNTYLPTSGGAMNGNIDMGANAITNVQKIHVDGAAPIYIGSTIESGATNAARLTGVAGGGAAFVKANTQGEYATVSVGTPTQREHAINMGYLVQDVIADQPTQPHQIANKDYVDTCTNKCVQAVESPKGVLKACLQNGSRQDVCVVSDAGLSSSIARYTAKGHLIDQGAPTENNHLANKQYVDNVVKAGNFSGDVQVGGDLTINGTASVLKPPTQDVDIPNKGYVDASLSDVVRKTKVAVSGNSSVNVPLSNGVYLLAVADNGHGGLVCVSVYPDGVTISGLVNLNGWTCARTTGENSVTLNNTASSNMEVYITSVGEGTYR
nr:MAG TPA: hypothetical protein [Herelleviridae sp.]